MAARPRTPAKKTTTASASTSPAPKRTPRARVAPKKSPEASDSDRRVAPKKSPEASDSDRRVAPKKSPEASGSDRRVAPEKTATKRARVTGATKRRPSADRLVRELVPMAADVRSSLRARKLRALYDARPAFQRNDYLMWIEAAKRPETRQKRLDQMLDELARGGVYMKMAWSPKR